MPSSWLDASDAAGPSFSQLTATVQATEAKLVIVDNLAVVSGSVDENSADMTTVLSSFRQLSEDTGAAVVLVHHQRKQTGFKTRAGDTLRGHSGIEAALNLALLIEREEHAESITLRATKTRGVTVLPFGAMFSYEHKQDSDELAEARFFGLELEDTTSNAAIERAIIEELKNTPSMTQRQLIDGIKASLDVGIHRIRNAARRWI